MPSRVVASRRPSGLKLTDLTIWPGSSWSAGDLGTGAVDDHHFAPLVPSLTTIASSSPSRLHSTSHTVRSSTMRDGEPVLSRGRVPDVDRAVRARRGEQLPVAAHVEPSRRPRRGRTRGPIAATSISRSRSSEIDTDAVAAAHQQVPAVRREVGRGVGSPRTPRRARSPIRPPPVVLASQIFTAVIAASPVISRSPSGENATPLRPRLVSCAEKDSSSRTPSVGDLRDPCRAVVARRSPGGWSRGSSRGCRPAAVWPVIVKRCSPVSASQMRTTCVDAPRGGDPPAVRAPADVCRSRRRSREREQLLPRGRSTTVAIGPPWKMGPTAIRFPSGLKAVLHPVGARSR